MSLSHSDSMYSCASKKEAARERKRAAKRAKTFSQADKNTRRLVAEITGAECSLATDSGGRSIFLNGRLRVQHFASKLINRNPYFDFALGLLIVANSTVIGIETQLRLDDDHEEEGVLFWLESFFLVCFLSELVVRWLADGTKNLYNGWFWFDFLLVATGVIYTWIVGPILVATSQDVPIISQVLTLRVLRLMRLVRALRLMEQFQELWKLCSGLLKSARTMLSVCLLVLIALFVFACVGVDLISGSSKLNGNEETRQIIEVHFSSLMVTLLTLMQFANADSLASIYLPLCKVEPSLVLYFLAMWLVVTVALMNLVTAIIVENALAKGREDAEEKQNILRKMLKKHLPDIEEVFDKLDLDKSGCLEMAELQEAARDAKIILPEDLKEYVDPFKLLEIFDLLDADRSGMIERSEFVDGIATLVVSAVPLETTQILALLRQSHEVLLDSRKTLARLEGYCPDVEPTSPTRTSSPPSSPLRPIPERPVL